MTFLPRLDAATPACWPDLVDELDRWGEAGHVANLWWRDDDAVAATPQLEELLRLAGGVPLAVAVIPGSAEPDLAQALRGMSHVAVLQHGWRHTNHAVASDKSKKSEFPATRPAGEAAADLVAGASRLWTLFGPQIVPILAPPWNNFAMEFLPLLAPAGIAGLSTMASELSAMPAGSVVPIDVHVDLVAWKAGRGFIGTGAALGLLVGHLRARRVNATGSTRATGILTHHLMMDSATAAFLEQLLAVVSAHGAARWVAAAELITWH
jgi:hypothetical protein